MTVLFPLTTFMMATYDGSLAGLGLASILLVGLFFAFEQQEPSDLYGKGGTATVRYEYTLCLPFTIHLNKVEEDGVSHTMISQATRNNSPSCAATRSRCRPLAACSSNQARRSSGVNGCRSNVMAVLTT